MNFPGRGSLSSLLFMIAMLFGVQSLVAQQEVTAVKWGEFKANPDLGFNARIRTQHQEPFCQQPEPSLSELDWNNLELLDRIAQFHPGLLRFPGGTPANFWIWEDEVQQVVDPSGGTELLNLCEGSVIGRTYSSKIGCDGIAQELDLNSLSQIYTNTTVTLQSYKSAIEYLRNQDFAVDEIFVLGVFDPRYYVGSPQLTLERGSHSTWSKKQHMKNKGVQRAVAQLDKILFEYCGDCTSYDGAFSFELGNELHLARYGKFLPSTDCFTADICNECLPDVDFYSDLCEAIIPEIRSRFPQAKVAINGSRDLAGEPWNQVIIDRFASGDVYAEAAMMHFYPRTTNPDSLDWSLCQALETAVDIEEVLHYQQVFTEYLFDQRNTDLFLGTGMELWFTEFNNYDNSERCAEEFGVVLDDDEHTYDSGNWLHALSIFNLFNSFSHYASEKNGPWSHVDHGLDITKMCMHLMFGRDRETAINSELEISAAGMAIKALMRSVQDTDSMANLLITPAEEISIATDGSWTAVEEEQGIPLRKTFSYSDKNGVRETAETWETYGWLFKGQQQKALVVNLAGAGRLLRLSDLPGFAGTSRVQVYKVPKVKLGKTLDAGLESTGLFIEEFLTTDSEILLPPYSFVEVDLNHTYPRPDNNGCASAHQLDEVELGKYEWKATLYNGAGGNRPSCVNGATVNDIWYAFTPESRDELIQAVDSDGRLDLVIELYEACDQEPIACLDAYGIGEEETGFVNDLEMGAEYRFRVYAKQKDDLEIDHIRVQVSAPQVAGLLPTECGKQAFHAEDVLRAVPVEEIYTQDPGVDAYRYKFIPVGGGPAIAYKYESNTPHILPLHHVSGLEPWTEYEVKVQQRIRAEANGTVETLWSEISEGCVIGYENNCGAFLTPPVGLTKSLEPVNGLIDRLQLKWYKATPEVPYAVADSAACDIEYWPVKDLITGIALDNPIHTTLYLKRKAGKELFKWPLKFDKPQMMPSHSYRWKVRCACEYGEDIMSPWSEEKFFNTPAFDPLTHIFTSLGSPISGEGDGKGIILDAGSTELIWNLSFDEPVESVTLSAIDGSLVPVQFDQSKNGLRIRFEKALAQGLYFLNLNGHSGQKTISVQVLD